MFKWFVLAAIMFTIAGALATLNQPKERQTHCSTVQNFVPNTGTHLECITTP